MKIKHNHDFFFVVVKKKSKSLVKIVLLSTYLFINIMYELNK